MPLDDIHRLKMLVQLADMKNVSGDPRGAVEALDRAQAILQKGMPITAEGSRHIQNIRLTAYLRTGEVENCLYNHNRDCCIFPIKDGGLHKRKAGFQAAEALILEHLRNEPQSLAYRWLLTVVSMGLDKYPQGADPKLVLDPKVFRSEQEFPRFLECAEELGVTVDDIAGGTIVDDFNRDGWLDIFLSSWSRSGQIRFFVNQGNGRFVERTREAGLLGITGGLNIFQADYDNDGFLDVYIVRGAWLDQGGQDPDSLLRNNGDGTFSDRTESSGLLSFKPALTAVWADFNKDGLVDLFVGNESMAETKFDPELYLNQGNGKFAECARISGVGKSGFIRGVAVGDYDNDGWIDLYVSRLGEDNLLYRNEGQPPYSGTGWVFSEVGRAAGVTEPRFSFPCWFWDYDNDGWVDIFVSGYSTDFTERTLEELVKGMFGQPCKVDKPRLYRNNRDGTFRDATVEAGLDRVVYAMGANFGDLDNDGYLDFYAGTGDPNLATLVPNLMFRNDQGRRFLDVTTAGGFGHLQKGHAIGFGDLDGDGAQEIVINLGGAARGDNFRDAIFKNPGFKRKWLKLSLEGTRTNRAALGSRVKVTVEDAGGERSIHRTVSSGGSFGASTLRLEVGLGDAARIREVEIFWPVSGRRDRFDKVGMNAAYFCREGDSVLKKIAP